MDRKVKFLSGVLYTSIAKYSIVIIQLIVTAILSRILTPSDYGIVSIATVFIIFFNMISDIGIGPAIIQKKDLTQQDLMSIFSFTIYLGFFASLAFFFSSWLISDYYADRKLLPVCQSLCLVVFFSCAIIVPQNLLYKHKDFKKIAYIQLFVNILSAVISIILAICGFGVYSLVCQQIISSLFMFVIMFNQNTCKFLCFKICVKKESLMKIYSFSLYQFLFNVINYFSRNMDKILVGKYIGLSSLGQYDKAYRLMLMPLQNITFVVTPVVLPIFSDIQNNLYEMAEKYRKIFVILCYIGFPLSVLLFFCGSEIIMIMFGSQWHDAIIPFKILSLTLGFQLLNGTSGAIYQAANATKQLFYSGCWCSFFMITGFCVAIIGWHTIVAVSIGYLFAQILNSAQTYFLLFKTLKYPLVKILLSMIHPIAISLVIGLSLFIISLFCNSIPLWTSLALKGLLFVLIGGFLIEFTGPYKRVITNHLHLLKFSSL